MKLVQEKYSVFSYFLLFFRSNILQTLRAHRRPTSYALCSTIYGLRCDDATICDLRFSICNMASATGCSYVRVCHIVCKKHHHQHYCANRSPYNCSGATKAIFFSFFLSLYVSWMRMSIMRIADSMKTKNFTPTPTDSCIFFSLVSLLHSIKIGFTCFCLRRCKLRLAPIPRQEM